MNEIDFSINDRCIVISGKIIDLPYPVVDALTIGGLVIVRVEPDIGDIFNSNVYGFAADSNFKWQITESPHGTEVDKPFTSISVLPDNQLIAGNWNGIDYTVDLTNGAISTASFNK